MVEGVIADGHQSSPRWTGCFHIKPHFLQLGLGSGFPLLLPSGRLPSAPLPLLGVYRLPYQPGESGPHPAGCPAQHRQPAQGPTCCGFVTTGSHPYTPGRLVGGGGGVDEGLLPAGGGPEYS